MVMIAPTTIDVGAVMRDPTELTSRLGLPTDFLAEVADSAQDAIRNTVVYYYINRGIASILLERALCQISAYLMSRDVPLASLSPGLVDGIVEYQFPTQYDQV